jgi:hypothetical protein
MANQNGSKSIMRKITLESVSAFLTSQPFSQGNMTVTVNGNYAELLLHGNCIAYRTGNDITIRDAGWQTVTTKERLNGLLDMLRLPRIYQKDFAWYIGDKPWNGKAELSTDYYGVYRIAAA